MVIDTLAMLAQMACIAVWTYFEMDTMSNGWSLPAGLLLISFGWWESYVTEDGWLSVLWKIKDKMSDLTSGPGEQKLIDGTVCGIHVQILADDPKKKANARGPTYLFISMWKIGCFLMLMSTMLKEEGIISSNSLLYTNFTTAFETLEYRLLITNTTTNYFTPNQSIELLRWDKLWKGPAGIIVLQILSSWILYSVAKFANRCRIHYCFALAMTLVTPVCLFTLAPLCYYRLENSCAYTSTFPDHLFFQCPANMKYTTWMGEDYAIWLTGFISFCWISFHQIWRAPNIILADTSKIFSKLYYHGLLVDTCLMLNRRNDNKDKEEENKNEKPPQIVKGCATMWHENSEEIKVCLKSLFKMDEDYCVRKLRGKVYDQFEWECHVFFDDCMMELEDKWKSQLNDEKTEKTDGKKEEKKSDDSKKVVNTFVLDLLKTVDAYGTEWYNKIGVKFGKPEKILTPYGGRLTWMFPGGTKMIVHLKDKSKIRNKKRWSQIMYMYYFLGFQIAAEHGEKTPNDEGKMTLQQIQDKEKDDKEERNKRGSNIYLLALDGDVDFLPDSVLKVLDIMKKDDKIGAACGRIHPTGSGYMKWLQQYEYAFGHWMQKATEHILGCVLCSPGCFSLFRGEAVMDDNVMKTYTTLPTEAKHHIQYDQGEDRWLCTLMLKQGWRVEYTAASDSYTACPLTFKEFYNQRRRWMPSTLLNVIDLVSDWKDVVEKNDNISGAYMFYQLFNNIIGTTIGPGFIVLMLIGASSLAFGLTSTESLILNALLVGFFIFSCMFMKRDHQIMIAQVLTLVYAVMIIAVYIGVAIQIGEDGPLSLSAMACFFTLGSAVLPAILHPQEFNDVFCFIIYLATVPSMYLLLTVYSFFNMDDSSWGTREVKTPESEKAAGGGKKPKKEGGVMGFFRSITSGNFKLPKLHNTNEDKIQAMSDKIINKLDCLDRMEKMLIHANKGVLPDDIVKDILKDVKKNPEEKKEEGQDEVDSKKQNVKVKDKWIKYYRMVVQNLPEERKKRIEKQFLDWAIDAEGDSFWINDIGSSSAGRINKERSPILFNAKRKDLDSNERKFWRNMIKEYLYPLNPSKEEKAKTAEELKQFKTQISLGFVLVNIMWVTAIFMLQAYQDILGMRWPLGGKLNDLYFDQDDLETANVVTLHYEYLKLDPIGLVFVVAFIIVICLMTFGMLLHRIVTLEQIVADTHLTKKEIVADRPIDILENMRVAYRMDKTKLGNKATMKEKVNFFLQAEEAKLNQNYFDLM